MSDKPPEKGYLHIIESSDDDGQLESYWEFRKTKANYENPKDTERFNHEYILAESLKELRRIWKQLKQQEPYPQLDNYQWQAIDNLARKMGWDN